MNKLLLCLALVASCSAYTGVTGDCAACATAAGSASNYCAYESSSNCGCNSCGSGVVNAFRINDCSLNACGDRRLAETTDLEEATQQTARVSTLNTYQSFHAIISCTPYIDRS